MSNNKLPKLPIQNQEEYSDENTNKKISPSEELGFLAFFTGWLGFMGIMMAITEKELSEKLIGIIMGIIFCSLSIGSAYFAFQFYSKAQARK